MSAAGAFLGEVEALVEEDGVVRAGIHTRLATGALVGIDDDEAVIPLVDSVVHGAGRHARSLIAVLAGGGEEVHLHLGHGAPDELALPQPELAGVGLGFGNRLSLIHI